MFPELTADLTCIWSRMTRPYSAQFTRGQLEASAQRTGSDDRSSSERLLLNHCLGELHTLRAELAAVRGRADALQARAAEAEQRAAGAEARAAADAEVARAAAVAEAAERVAAERERLPWLGLSLPPVGNNLLRGTGFFSHGGEARLRPATFLARGTRF